MDSAPAIFPFGLRPRGLNLQAGVKDFVGSGFPARQQILDELEHEIAFVAMSVGPQEAAMVQTHVSIDLSAGGLLLCQI